MKVKEFSDKYKIDYNTVYTCAWLISDVGGGSKYDYDENALRNAVMDAAQRRMYDAQRKLDRAKYIYDQCLKIQPD